MDERIEPNIHSISVTRDRDNLTEILNCLALENTRVKYLKSDVIQMVLSVANPRDTISCG